MTTNEKVARRKFSLLELAKELNNVSKACKLIGYSRQQFYEIRRNYQTYGAEVQLNSLGIVIKGDDLLIPLRFIE